MLRDSTFQTITDSLTEPNAHPVSEFFKACGLDIRNFPKLTITIEVKEKLFNKSQVYLPLRIPRHPGLVYDSFFRVLRYLELPNSDLTEHRKFVELEWKVDVRPLLEEEHHAVFSFISGEVECPACKTAFLPDATILNDTSVRISCPNCLHYWTIRVDSPFTESLSTTLLTDIFSKDPGKVKKLVSSWSRGDSTDRNKYFNTEFQAQEKGSALDWLFGEEIGFLQSGIALDGDLERLTKTLTNHFMSKFVEQDEKNSGLDRTEILTKTDVLTKTDIQPKTIDQERKVLAEFFGTTPIKEVGEDDGGAWKSVTDTKLLLTPSPATLRAMARNKKVEKTWERPLIGALLTVILVLLGVLGYGMFVPKTYTPSEAPAEAAIAPLPKVEAPPTQPVTTLAPENLPTENKDTTEESLKMNVEDAQKASEKTEQAKEQQAEKKKIQVEPEKDGREEARQALIEAGYRQGLIHLKLQQSKEAAKEFERVIALDPRHADSYRNLGLAYVYDRQFKSAIGALEKYLSLAKQSSDRASIEELLTTLKERTSTSQ